MAEHKLIKMATKTHARVLGRTASAVSRREMLASGNWTNPERYARAVLNRSIEAHALMAPDGVLMALFGVLPVDRQWVSPWVATTEHFGCYPLVVLQVARLVLTDWRNIYPNMIFYVHGLDAGGLRLAVALGLRPETPEVRGPHGGMFCRVLVETKKVQVA